MIFCQRSGKAPRANSRTRTGDFHRDYDGAANNDGAGGYPSSFGTPRRNYGNGHGERYRYDDPRPRRRNTATGPAGNLGTGKPVTRSGLVATQAIAIINLSMNEKKERPARPDSLVHIGHLKESEKKKLETDIVGRLRRLGAEMTQKEIHELIAVIDTSKNLASLKEKLTGLHQDKDEKILGEIIQIAESIRK